MRAGLLKSKTLAVLKKRRQDAVLGFSDRIDELFKVEEFAIAYSAERSAEIQLVKASHVGGDVKKAKADLKKAQKSTDKVLKTLGKTREYLEVKYFCDKCLDTGLVDGKPCSCVQKLQSELAFDGRQSIANFTFSQSTETQEHNCKVFRLAQDWCDGFLQGKNDKTDFLIMGHTGVGKTFLTDCMVNALRQGGANVIYFTAYNLNKIFYDDFMSADKYLLDNLTQAEVLAIDDLGKEPVYNKISCESLYCLLNERNRNGKATIINTNNNIVQLREKYGEPITSRVINVKTTLLVELEGMDKRFEK